MRSGKYVDHIDKSIYKCTQATDFFYHKDPILQHNILLWLQHQGKIVGWLNRKICHFRQESSWSFSNKLHTRCRTSCLRFASLILHDLHPPQPLNCSSLSVNKCVFHFRSMLQKHNWGCGLAAQKHHFQEVGAGWIWMTRFSDIS